MKHWDDSQQTAFAFLLNGVVVGLSIYTIYKLYQFFTVSTIIL